MLNILATGIFLGSFEKGFNDKKVQTFAVLYSHFCVEVFHSNFVEGRVEPCIAFEISSIMTLNLSTVLFSKTSDRNTVVASNNFVNYKTRHPWESLSITFIEVEQKIRVYNHSVLDFSSDYG